MSLSAGKIPSAHRPVRLPPVSSPIAPLARRPNWRCLARKNYDHIPKQFRAENLADGLMDNYKNVPKFLYGLPSDQLNMFTSKDSILNRQSSKVTAESITSAGYYNKLANMNKDDNHNYNYNYNSGNKISMNKGSKIWSADRPPDLPSILLDTRIILLTLPLYEAVTHLIISQIHYLNFVDSSKPIYFYIRSTGILDSRMEVVGIDSEAYAIADHMDICETQVHTINMGMAYGHAALLVARGQKGHRFVLPRASTRLYLPRVYKSSGPSTHMWIQAKDFEANADIYFDMLSESTGKPKDQIAKEARHMKCFRPQEAIDYGLADRILYRLDDETRDTTNKKMREAKAMMQAAKAARTSDPSRSQMQIR